MAFKAQKIIDFLLLIFLFILFYLFFRSLAEIPGDDIYEHVKFAEKIALHEKSYPSNFLLYFLLNVFNGKVSGQIIISCILALSLCLKFILIKYYVNVKSISKTQATIYAVILLFIFSAGNINLNKGFLYLGSFTSTVWHNSTTIVLIPFALLLYYFITYMKSTWANNLVILLLIVLNASIKPSFLFVLIPFLLLVALLDPINRIRFFVFCLAIVATIIVQYYLIYQLNIGSIQNEKSSVGIEILGFFKIYSRFQYLPIAFLLGYLFPIIFLIFNNTYLKKKEIIYSWVMVLIALTLFCLFVEEGPRKRHGNFYWQIVPTSLILFLTIFKELINNFNKINTRYLISFIFSLHVIYGFYYFYEIAKNKIIL